MKKPITLARFQELYWNYTNAEVAKKLGIQPQTVIQYAKRFGIEMKKHRRNLKVRILDK